MFGAVSCAGIILTGYINQVSCPDYDYLSYRLTNLSCGSVYSFNLVCHNIAGRSKPSATITTPTLGSPPSEVSLDKMISLNSTFITLHLHRWPDGGCPIKYYVIEYKEESQPTWRIVSNNIRWGWHQIKAGGTRLTVFGVLFQKINGVSYLISESFVMLNRNLPSPGDCFVFSPRLIITTI